MTTTVLVTGASRGIGAAIALRLGSQGCRVALVARTSAALTATASAVEAAGGRAHIVPVDLGRPGAASEAVVVARRALGPLDAVVSNAGMIEPIDRLEAADMGAWADSVAVNLLAPAGLAHAALPDLVERGGRFIALSSTAANLPIEGLSAYCVAKAGLRMLVQVLALEAPQVTSLSVQPGPVDTGMHDSLRADTRSALAPERAQLYHDLRSQGRLRPPDVPGRSIAWLTLAAPPEWSGQEIEHDDPRIVAGAAALFDPPDKEHI